MTIVEGSVVRIIGDIDLTRVGRVCHSNGVRCCVQWAEGCFPAFLAYLQLAEGDAPQCSSECANGDCLKPFGN